MATRERLRISFRKHQIIGSLDPEDSLADFGNVVVQCQPDGSAIYVPGTVDQTWTEVTDFTTGLDKLDVQWDYLNSSDASTATSTTNEAGSNYDKGVTDELTFNDAAFQYIYDYLLDDVCGILNAIDVRIVDQVCNRTLRLFELKTDNLTYRPLDAPCEVVVALREQDEVWACVHKTFIWDNWQSWFLDGGAKQHPCFLTCVEPRPRLVASARMGLSIFGQTVPLVSSILDENENVFRRILNTDNFVDSPLIRDIITNACGKCNLAIDTLFHDPANPYYNACLYYPVSGAWHKNDNDGVTSPALWFHLDSRWDITIADFLDKLKVLFNAEWYVTPNSTLVFKPTAAFLALPPIADFSTGALPVWNLEYTFDGDKKPAYARYQYTPDASDLATQEIAPLYNDIVGFDPGTYNQMLEGSLIKDFDFAATGFVRDGKAQADYMRELINDGETVAYAIIIVLAVIIASLLGGVLSAGAAAALGAFLAAWLILIASKANHLRDVFGDPLYTGAVRITAEQVGTPRILLWDGVALDRAKVVQADPDTIAPSPTYNAAGDSYRTLNTFLYEPVGGLRVMNYPLYFDSQFLGNLFDRFMDAIDNPLKSLDTHQSFEFETDMCCEVLDTLGVWADDFTKIGYQLIIEQRPKYAVYGRIEHIELTYEDEQVKLRGRVIKKPS